MTFDMTRNSPLRVIMIGLFAVDYMISLANALSEYCDPTLYLSKRHLAYEFPRSKNVEDELRNRCILLPKVSLELIDYPRGQYWKKIRMGRRIAQNIRTKRPDLIHYQSGGEPWFVPTLILLHDLPLVTTVHDAKHHPGDKPPRIILQMKNSLLTRLTDQIIVHGEQQADALIKKYKIPLQEINVTYIGSSNIYSKLSTTSGPRDGHTILFFGRVVKYKGIDVLVKAAPLIAAHVPDLRIVIAGSGNNDALQQAKDKNPEWFDICNRYITAEEVPHFFNQAALVVLPYLDATQSAIIPIAYTFGCPVVATKVGSIPEVVEDGKTGFLVEPGDERSFADAVIRLLLNPDLRSEMGKAAALKAKEDLSWESIAKTTLRVYERAVQ